MISIYIAAYLRLALPDLSGEIYKDSIKGELQNYVCVIGNGFKEEKLVQKREYNVQILIASTSDQLANEKAMLVYGALPEMYNFEFPAPAGTSNDALSVKGFRPIQAPMPLGRIGSIYQYTINYEISGGIYQWQQV